MYVCLSLGVVCVCEYRCLQRPEEEVRFLGAGLTSDCESPDVGAGNQTQVLWEAASALNEQPPYLLR